LTQYEVTFSKPSLEEFLPTDVQTSEDEGYCPAYKSRREKSFGLRWLVPINPVLFFLAVERVGWPS
jgi:hypothetical protein